MNPCARARASIAARASRRVRTQHPRSSAVRSGVVTRTPRDEHPVARLEVPLPGLGCPVALVLDGRAGCTSPAEVRTSSSPIRKQSTPQIHAAVRSRTTACGLITKAAAADARSSIGQLDVGSARRRSAGSRTSTPWRTSVRDPGPGDAQRSRAIGHGEGMSWEVRDHGGVLPAAMPSRLSLDSGAGPVDELADSRSRCGRRGRPLTRRNSARPEPQLERITTRNATDHEAQLDEIARVRGMDWAANLDVATFGALVAAASGVLVPRIIERVPEPEPDEPDAPPADTDDGPDDRGGGARAGGAAVRGRESQPDEEPKETYFAIADSPGTPLEVRRWRPGDRRADRAGGRLGLVAAVPGCRSCPSRSR